MGWSEMAGLRAAARLARTDLYGPISPPMQAWIDEMGLGKKLRHQGEAISGFRAVGGSPTLRCVAEMPCDKLGQLAVQG